MPQNYYIDDDMVDIIQSQYSRVLDNAGLNVADPVAANIGFFNNTGKVYADPMKLGRSMIFFTRPNLNFRSGANIQRSRIFSYYSSNALSSGIMRQLMFPDLAKEMYYAIYGRSDNKIPVRGTCDDRNIGGRVIIEGEDSIPIVRSNFIPLLSNACVSASGGKDITIDTYETKGNFSGDKLKYAGGVDDTLTVGEFTCEFEDLYHSPILIIFYLWIMYMHYVAKAICDPEWAYIVHRIIDYTISVYIFMLGTDNQTIIRWVKYGGCFPINIPFTSIQHSRTLNTEDLRNINITMAYNFMCPMDPVTLTEFNMLSGPSLYERLKRYYGLSDGIINTYIGEHSLSIGNAARILADYGPVYEGKVGSNTLPMRKLEQVKGKSIPDNNKYPVYPTGYEGLENGEGYNALLKNRANGLIVNNFYGVPYITEGNRLMFL
jgi:hypothetical protein